MTRPFLRWLDSICFSYVFHNHRRDICLETLVIYREINLEFFRLKGKAFVQIHWSNFLNLGSSAKNLTSNLRNLPKSRNLDVKFSNIELQSQTSRTSEKIEPEHVDGVLKCRWAGSDASRVHAWWSRCEILQILDLFCYALTTLQGLSKFNIKHCESLGCDNYTCLVFIILSACWP